MNILIASCLLSFFASSCTLLTFIRNENDFNEDTVFGLSLLGQLELKNGGILVPNNLIIGPNGLRNVLAMLRAGARRTTEQQIAAVIG